MVWTKSHNILQICGVSLQSIDTFPVWLPVFNVQLSSGRANPLQFWKKKETFLWLLDCFVNVPRLIREITSCCVCVCSFMWEKKEKTETKRERERERKKGWTISSSKLLFSTTFWSTVLYFRCKRRDLSSFNKNTNCREKWTYLAHKDIKSFVVNFPHDRLKYKDATQETNYGVSHTLIFQ